MQQVCYNQNMKSLEVLSPAGDIESFYVAVNNGADAVYLGLKNFNARNKAGNFDFESLKTAVDYAHLFGVKVYITLNTIVTDEEMQELLLLVYEAVQCKVDAFIIQDLGVASVLKNTYKNIVLHASTQLGIHNLQGAKMAQEIGFSRVVLSRETTLEDIKDISKNTNLEIEYFVQGALCVAFSGNCYLSSLQKCESGNRGRCLQLCRLPYCAKIGEREVGQGFLLSPTDNCFINQLQMLQQAGVCSLKIEGRMRRASYVGIATAMYRQAVDNLNTDTAKLENDLKKVFFRGEYNHGLYLAGNREAGIINKQFQNHRGVYIGRVLSVKPFKDLHQISIESKTHRIVQGDGLKFIFGNSEQSMGVGNVIEEKNTYTVFSKTKPNENSRVYLAVDAENEKIYVSKQAKLPLEISFVAKPNEKAKLMLTCAKTSCVVQSDWVSQTATNKPLSQEDIEVSLTKLGDTNFVAESVDIVAENVFIPKSFLNQLRRCAVDLLKTKILEEYEKQNIPNIVENKVQKPVLKEIVNKNFVIVNETTQTEFECENVVLAPINFTQETIELLMQKFPNKKYYLNLPNVLQKQDFNQVDDIVKNFKGGLVANNIYGLQYACLGYEVVGGYMLNIANKYTAQFLQNLGIKTFVKSIEHFAEDFNCGCVYCGTPAVMTFCHCPYKTVFENKDCSHCLYQEGMTYNHQGKTFEIRRTKINKCYFELLSSQPIGKQISTKQLKEENNVMLDLRK